MLTANQPGVHRLGGAKAEEDRLRELVIDVLRASDYRPLRQLKCEVIDGVAVLSGVVPTFYLKQMAQVLALRVRQLAGVRNLTEVRRTRS
jgi:hypothetical protein